MSSLPAPLTRFVGRVSELSEAAALLAVMRRDPIAHLIRE